MCKPTKSIITLTLRDENGREYLVEDTLLVHWAKRLEPTHKEVMEDSLITVIDTLKRRAEAEEVFEQDFFD